MTTSESTAQPIAESGLSERVSRLEGVVSQMDKRIDENTQAINALRVENSASHQELSARIDNSHQELSAKVNELSSKVDTLRSEMYRLVFMSFGATVGILGTLMAIFRFLG